MFQHQDIWQAIDTLAKVHGYSPSGLAKKAGLDPTSFNKSKRMSTNGKPRWPSTESLAKILAVTGTPMIDFIGLIGVDADADHIEFQEKQNAIPLLGMAQAGRDGYFDIDGYPSGDEWDIFILPTSAAQQNRDDLFALRVAGDSMEPLYRHNDILIVSPSTSIRKGDRIIVKKKNGEVMAKQLRRNSSERIELMSLNTAYDDYNLPTQDIDWIARILWVSQ